MMLHQDWVEGSGKSPGFHPCRGMYACVICAVCVCFMCVVLVFFMCYMHGFFLLFHVRVGRALSDKLVLFMQSTMNVFDSVCLYA